MTTPDYIAVAIRTAVLGLAVYACTRAAVKPALRWLARRRGGARSRLYSDGVRLAAVLIGLGLALLPGVWPEWVTTTWAGLCGVVAGSLSVGLHHAVEKALPDAVARILTGGGVQPAPKWDAAGDVPAVDAGEAS